MAQDKYCPQCQTLIEIEAFKDSLSVVCVSCGTRSVNISALALHFTAPSWTRALSRHRQLKKSRGKTCGRSDCQMRAVDLVTRQKTFEIDICHACNQVWFDLSELEQLAQTESVELNDRLPDHIREELRKITIVDGVPVPRHTVFDFSAHDFHLGWAGSSVRKLGWRALLALIGLPVEHKNRLRRAPYVTYGVMFAIVAVSLAAFYLDPVLVERLGFLTSQPFRLGGLTWLTAFFLHADYGHLLGNLYMLWIFGDNVEDDTGWRYPLLLLAGTLLGKLFFGLSGHHPDTLLIGASAGISAIIAYYALAYPRRQFSLLLGFVVWLRIPVFFYVLVWIGLQLAGARFSEPGTVATAFNSHLGGALAGALFWLGTKRRRARPGR